MPLQVFSFPFSETRFFKAGSFIYKVKIRSDSKYSGEEVRGTHCYSQEMEEIIRTVLGNVNNLQPFSSTNFHVFLYKKRWEGASKEICKHCERNLKAYPFVLILYLEKNGKQAQEKSSVSCSKGELNTTNIIKEQIPSVSEPKSKRRKIDSALEDAILKDLMADLEMESKVPVISRWYRGTRTVEKVREDSGYADKKSGRGTSYETQPGTMQDMNVEETEEKGEHAQSEFETPVRPGILTRIASRIFPLSLFFKDP